MIAKESINAQEVREQVLEISEEHLPFEAAGYECTTEMVYDVLLKAATEGLSIEAACQQLEDVVDGNTIRSVLNEQLEIEQIRAHEQQINGALASVLPDQIKSQGLEGAMDLHDEPFYGKDEALCEVACRSKAKQGTTRFMRTASAYVIYRQLRLTLAITFVLPTDSTLDVVKRLDQRLQALSLQLDVIYFDKGFCCGEVIRYLQQEQQPAVLACSIRGKAGGTRQLCQGRKSYRTTYTFTDGSTADVAMVATLPPGKDGQRRRKWLLFVVVNLEWSAHCIYRRYRRRFGIECSYRIGREVRIKTTSRNPMMRFFGFAFALLLVTIWATLRWFIARIPGRGPHRIDPVRFPFHLFTQFLRRAVEQLRGVVDSVSLSCPFTISIY
jgi:putative transposase